MTVLLVELARFTKQLGRHSQIVNFNDTCCSLSCAVYMLKSGHIERSNIYELLAIVFVLPE